MNHDQTLYDIDRSKQKVREEQWREAAAITRKIQLLQENRRQAVQKLNHFEEENTLRHDREQKKRLDDQAWNRRDLQRQMAQDNLRSIQEKQARNGDDMRRDQLANSMMLNSEDPFLKNQRNYRKNFFQKEATIVRKQNHYSNVVLPALNSKPAHVEEWKDTVLTQHEQM